MTGMGDKFGCWLKDIVLTSLSLYVGKLRPRKEQRWEITETEPELKTLNSIYSAFPGAPYSSAPKRHPAHGEWTVPS